MTWNDMTVGRRVCKPGSPKCLHFDILPFGFFLMIRYDGPDYKFAHDVTCSYTHFRAIMVDDYVVFLSRIGMSPWLPAYFHRAAATKKTPPFPSGNKGLPLYILLVDGATGCVKARRVAALDVKLSYKLHDLIVSQNPEDPLQNQQIMINGIKHAYSPVQLATLASMNWRIRS